MKKNLTAVASILLLGLLAGQASAAATGVSINTPTKSGTNPWVVGADGKVALDATVQAFIGAGFAVIDPNGKTVPGVVSLPGGNPTPGGAAVQWMGSVTNLTVPGAYKAQITIKYKDVNGDTQTLTAQAPISLP